MSAKRPLHPCPICGGAGRNVGGYNEVSYFRCDECEQPFSEKVLSGGRVEVAFRARLIRLDATQEAGPTAKETENSRYIGAA